MRRLRAFLDRSVASTAASSRPAKRPQRAHATAGNANNTEARANKLELSGPSLVKPSV